MPSPDPTSARTDARQLSRRAVVSGAVAVGAGLTVTGTVTGCASGSTTPDDTAAAGPLGPAADVPVGGATIFREQRVVVTQASAGTFVGFSVVCPHQSCDVSSVEGAEILCPCHGSRFGLDGAVLTGPATSGLTAMPVTVQGDQITLA